MATETPLTLRLRGVALRICLAHSRFLKLNGRARLNAVEVLEEYFRSKEHQTKAPAAIECLLNPCGEDRDVMLETFRFRNIPVRTGRSGLKPRLPLPDTLTKALDNRGRGTLRELDESIQATKLLR